MTGQPAISLKNADSGPQLYRFVTTYSHFRLSWNFRLSRDPGTCVYDRKGVSKMSSLLYTHKRPIDIVSTITKDCVSAEFRDCGTFLKYYCLAVEGGGLSSLIGQSLGWSSHPWWRINLCVVTKVYAIRNIEYFQFWRVTRVPFRMSFPWSTLQLVSGSEPWSVPSRIRHCVLHTTSHSHH